MAEIAIYQDSRSWGRCRSCGAVIEWCETLKGKRMPFDAGLVVTRTQGSVIAERVIAYVDTDISPTHFQTCPDARRWRQHRKSGAK